VYRGAQPDPEQLEALVKAYGIKTVINLRGCCDPNPWYLEQARMSQHLQISLEDVSFSAGRLPPAGELRQLLLALERSTYPIYLHCFRGSDRTGLAAVMVLLLQDGISYDEARGQLGVRYGHLPLSRPRHLHRFLRLYEDWLGGEQLQHSPAAFRRWAMEEYDGGWCQYRIEHFAAMSGPPRAGEPLGYQVRVRNTGVRTWHLRPGLSAGVHLGYMLFDNDNNMIAAGRSGLLDADVPSGEAIDLTLVVAPIQKPGRYRLVVDLADEGHCWFYQAGAEPLEQELDIRE
jgi:hypothetical protein